MSQKSQYYRNLGFLLIILLLSALSDCRTTIHSSRRFKRGQITVMSYNIHHGAGTDGKYDLKRISEIIRRHSPDIVCLNEVDFQTERTNGDEQARQLAADLGMEFSFARNFEFQGGWYGNAILSKYPIYFAENKIYTTGISASQQGLLRVVTGLVKETRGLLHVIIKNGEQSVHIYTTHLGVDSLESAQQAKEMLGWILGWEPKGPTILAGDLNMDSHYQRVRELCYYFNDVFTDSAALFTYPSQNAQKRIDFILYNQLCVPLVAEVDTSAQAVLASDHFPVVASFKIKSN
jgi:endonuclease/exonuclease/phosphatase family metal-dependent hydrolase